MKETLTSYGMALAEHYGRHLEREDLDGVAIEAVKALPDVEDVEARRGAFAAITRHVSCELGEDAIDPMLAAQLRTVFTIDVGIGSLGRAAQEETPVKAHSEKSCFILDAEIVAIYW
jgi:hypothetical protein